MVTELHEARRTDENVTRQDRAEHERAELCGCQAIALPNPAFTFADEGGGQSETRSAEYRDREQLAHVQ